MWIDKLLVALHLLCKIQLSSVKLWTLCEALFLFECFTKLLLHLSVSVYYILPFIGCRAQSRFHQLVSELQGAGSPPVASSWRRAHIWDRVARTLHLLELGIAQATVFAPCLWICGLILLDVWSVAFNKHRDPPLSLKTCSCSSLYSSGLVLNHCSSLCVWLQNISEETSAQLPLLLTVPNQFIIFFLLCLTSYHPPKSGPLTLTLTHTKRRLSHWGGLDYHSALIDSLHGDEQEKWQW